MTEERNYNDVNKWAYGMVGFHAVQQEDENSARHAAKTLLDKLGADKDSKILLDGFSNDKNDIGKMLMIAAGEYTKRKGALSVSELVERHASEIETYVPEDVRPELLAEFGGEFGDLKIEKLMKTYEKAKLEVKNSHLYDEDTVKKAKKTKLKYDRLVNTINVLEEQFLAPLGREVDKKVTREYFAETYKEDTPLAA